LTGGKVKEKPFGFDVTSAVTLSSLTPAPVLDEERVPGEEGGEGGEEGGEGGDEGGEGGEEG